MNEVFIELESSRLNLRWYGFIHFGKGHHFTLFHYLYNQGLNHHFSVCFQFFMFVVIQDGLCYSFREVRDSILSRQILKIKRHDSIFFRNWFIQHYYFLSLQESDCLFYFISLVFRVSIEILKTHFILELLQV